MAVGIQIHSAFVKSNVSAYSFLKSSQPKFVFFFPPQGIQNNKSLPSWRVFLVGYLRGTDRTLVTVPLRDGVRCRFTYGRGLR